MANSDYPSKVPRDKSFRVMQGEHGPLAFIGKTDMTKREMAIAYQAVWERQEAVTASVKS